MKSVFLFTSFTVAAAACTSDDQSALADAKTVGDAQDACGKKALTLSGIDHDKFVQCVQDSLSISSGCAECYYPVADYGFKNCKAACLLGWCKSGCLSCTQPAQDQLGSCTGFSPSVADPCLEAAAGTLALTWSDCGDATTHAKVNDVQPATITLGTNTGITGTGSVDEQVTGGSYELDLTAAGLIHDSFKGDICSAKSFDISVLGVKVGTISWNGLACPVAAGDATVAMSVELASALPSQLASSTVALTATSTSGDKLICLNINLKKQMEAEASVDCSTATCQPACQCMLQQCGSEVDACLADATCAKGQACGLECACGDNDCALNCATQAGSPLALPVATCINSKCASTVEAEASVDCSTATCESACTCSLQQCGSQIDACLADAACAKGQACALGCACGDTQCSLNCATQAGSPLALPVATCINSKCSSTVV